jgi:hypothetical protein
MLGVIMACFGELPKSTGIQREQPLVERLTEDEYMKMAQRAASVLPLIKKYQSKPRELYDIQWELHLQTHKAERYEARCKRLRAKLVASQAQKVVVDQGTSTSDLDPISAQISDQGTSTEDLSLPTIDSGENKTSDDNSTPPNIEVVDQDTSAGGSQRSTEETSPTGESTGESNTAQKMSTPRSAEEKPALQSAQKESTQSASVKDEQITEIKREGAEALHKFDWFLRELPTPPPAYPESCAARNADFNPYAQPNPYTGRPREWGPTLNKKWYKSMCEPGVWALDDERNGWMILTWVSFNRIWYCASHGIALKVLGGKVQWATGPQNDHVSGPELKWEGDETAGPMWYEMPVQVPEAMWSPEHDAMSPEWQAGQAAKRERRARKAKAKWIAEQAAERERRAGEEAEAELKAEQVAEHKRLEAQKARQFQAALDAQADAAVKAALDILRNKEQPQKAQNSQAPMEPQRQSARQRQCGADARDSAGIQHQSQHHNNAHGHSKTHPSKGPSQNSSTSSRTTSNAPGKHDQSQQQRQGASQGGKPSRFFTNGQPKFTPKNAGHNNTNGKQQQHGCSQSIPPQPHQGKSSHYA